MRRRAASTAVAHRAPRVVPLPPARSSRRSSSLPNDCTLMLRNLAKTSDLVVDWVGVRVLVTPEPEVTLAPEEKLR